MKLRVIPRDGADQPRRGPSLALPYLLVVVRWSQDLMLISRLFPAISLAQHVQSSSRARKDSGTVRFIRQNDR